MASILDAILNKDQKLEWHDTFREKMSFIFQEEHNITGYMTEHSAHNKKLEKLSSDFKSLPSFCF